MAMLRPHLAAVGFASAEVNGQQYEALNVIDSLGLQLPTTGWPRVVPHGAAPCTRYSNTEIPAPTTHQAAAPAAVTPHHRRL